MIRKLPSKNGHENNYRLISHKHPKSAVAEAYRTLRTNLGFSSLDKPHRIILVTSAGPGEGKSTTSANLAVVLAQAGHKVIIVDCDLRKPVQHKIFEVENSRGVTNCLLKNLSLVEVAHYNLVDNLTVLTSGPIPPNPAELLGSKKIRSLLQDLSHQFEYVIIDSPPILAVTDASLLATQVDGVILVVRSGSTRTDVAVEAKEQLLRANANIIGVVLNGINVHSKGYHYYYYYDSQSQGEKLKL